ncbi:hypothetical protein I5L01_06125 [Erythrobacter sp. YJ-T3-07]|uniref:hypothetical protein n=1 Tax=Erythrobacter sp. YJ-T3-07 TaxID=2793063 RepID=UPI0018D4467E|nr:hypothetical protein [Erythrobacter sp. YJ-T3-07]MBH1943810.1 hypothetical protein [Erythrobacter sp. YJ-T3-07]
MLTIVLILAIVVILASLIVAALRRHDSNNYFDQDRQPFYAEPDRLVEGGLLYSQKDYETKEAHTYTVTPAGEAGLRAWLREPNNDPGLLMLNYAGIVEPKDPQQLASARRPIHTARKAEYERLEQLLINRPEWRYALAASRLGIRFERACLGFWEEIATEHAPGSEPSEKGG